MLDELPLEDMQAVHADITEDVFRFWRCRCNPLSSLRGGDLSSEALAKEEAKRSNPEPQLDRRAPYQSLAMTI